jgi:hypothetical protein
LVRHHAILQFELEEPRESIAETESRSAAEVNRKLTSALSDAGRRFGFDVRTEYPLRGARIDVVWLWQPLVALPGVEGSLPVVGFEVESTWRTRKHVKGDLLNLQDLGAALGVIVLAGSGKRVDALRAFARGLTNRPGPLVLIWSERDVEALSGIVAGVNIRGLPVADGIQPGAPVSGHAGKYKALWEWLCDQKAAVVSATFAEIEQVLGVRSAGFVPEVRGPLVWVRRECCRPRDP